MYYNIRISEYSDMDKLKTFKRAAEILRAIAHPTRLMILELLLRKQGCVKEFEEVINKRQANISQHLAILRGQGLIDYIQEGKKRCYYLRKPESVRKILKCVRELNK